MNGSAGTYRPYDLPGGSVARWSADPVRIFIVFVTVFILGYGARLDNDSPFTMQIFEAFVGNAFSIAEVLLIVVTGLELIRRLTVNDLTIERSRAVRPVLALLLIVGVWPFLHMVAVEGGVRLPLELLFLPMFCAIFFIYLFLYRREDLSLMLWLVAIAGIYKSVEGVCVYIDRGVRWGLLTGWRDGMLLGMMLLGALFAFVVKPDSDGNYRKIRIAFFSILPLATFSFMGSMRRSFMLGVVGAVVILYFSLRGGERLRAVWVFTILVVLSAASLLFVGLGAFSTRVSAIAEPTTEGSAAYRLIEIYNVAHMVAERPLTGWPLGAKSQNMTGIQFEEISSLMPHNVYLYVMFRGGILGLVAWVAMLTVMMRLHYRTIRAARTSFHRFLSLWLASATILVIFCGFTTPVITDRLQLFYPFMMVMASFLPGAWGTSKSAPALPERA